jgi:hypothetical protein
MPSIDGSADRSGGSRVLPVIAAVVPMRAGARRFPVARLVAIVVVVLGSLTKRLPRDLGLNAARATRGRGQSASPGALDELGGIGLALSHVGPPRP